MDHIVVDVEIKRPIESLENGWNDTHEMGVACAVVYEHKRDRFRVFGHTADDLERLRDRMLGADQITGYNIWGFDFPVIWGFQRDHWNTGAGEECRRLRRFLAPKTNDLLRRVWLGLGYNPDKFVSKTHGGWGLDVVAKATLGGRGKMGLGAYAPRWYMDGNWGRLVDYCLDDVAIETDLGRFVDRFGYVLGNDRIVALPADSYPNVDPGWFRAKPE